MCSNPLERVPNALEWLSFQTCVCDEKRLKSFFEKNLNFQNLFTVVKVVAKQTAAEPPGSLVDGKKII